MFVSVVLVEHELGTLPLLARTRESARVRVRARAHTGISGARTHKSLRVFAFARVCACAPCLPRCFSVCTSLHTFRVAGGLPDFNDDRGVGHHTVRWEPKHLPVRHCVRKRGNLKKTQKNKNCVQVCVHR